MDGPLNVAVVGAGAAGIGAAHLLARRHRVTLYEQEARLGGHVNTVVIPSGADEGTPVDTGFIVFNTRTYPRFIAFLEELGVPSREGDMSFSYQCWRTGIVYGGHDLDTLFARRRNLFHPDFLRLVVDMVRFNREGRSLVERGKDLDESLGRYTQRRGFSPTFVRHYLLPLGAAIWSTPADRMMEYPALPFLRFLYNHGLLSFQDRPAWRTVEGGSRRYVEAFARRFPGEVRRGVPVLAVTRPEAGARVRTAAGTEDFDALVLACHADQALRLLEDPSPEEARLLGSWAYESNVATLHTDPALMPGPRKVWSSWNFVRPREGAGKVTVTYWMNRLQGLRTRHDYFVTLNGSDSVAPDRVVAEFVYEHPTYTRESMASQAPLARAGEARRTWYCGAYRGYGFHEDAFASAAEAAQALGVPS